MTLDAPLVAALRRTPAGVKHHHAYAGGLLDHVVNLLRLADRVAPLYPELDRDLLVVGVLVHDIGKTGEFTYAAEIGLSDRGRRLGHLQIGAELITAASAGLPDELGDALLSVVMCHHGTDALRLRSFPSAEAIALYRLNAVDAQVKTALEHGVG